MGRTAVDGDGITTPDVFRVDVGEADVLNDDVLCVADDSDSLALDDTLGALADQALVGADGHTKDTGLVVCDLADLGSFGLVVAAPVVLVDGDLALGASSPRSTSGLGSGAFSASEIEGFGQDNYTG